MSLFCFIDLIHTVKVDKCTLSKNVKISRLHGGGLHCDQHKPKPGEFPAPPTRAYVGGCFSAACGPSGLSPTLALEPRGAPATPKMWRCALGYKG